MNYVKLMLAEKNITTKIKKIYFHSFDNEGYTMYKGIDPKKEPFKTKLLFAQNKGRAVKKIVKMVSFYDINTWDSPNYDYNIDRWNEKAKGICEDLGILDIEYLDELRATSIIK